MVSSRPAAILVQMFEAGPMKGLAGVSDAEDQSNDLKKVPYH
jgi:hypothetical protein